MLELQVAQDDDLFNTEEPAVGVRDRRIVVEKTPERETKLEKENMEKSKKERKNEKRKVEENEQEQSGSGSDVDEKTGKEKERNVKSKYVVFLYHDVERCVLHHQILTMPLRLFVPEKNGKSQDLLSRLKVSVASLKRNTRKSIQNGSENARAAKKRRSNKR